MKRKLVLSTISVLLALFSGIFHGVLAVTSQQHNESDFVIAAYFPDYRTYIDVNKPAKYMTDLILFSISPSTSGKISDSPCCLQPVHYFMAKEARSYNPDLRIFVTVGGGDRSGAFAELLSSEDGRKTFVTELIELCRKEELNGIDLDWEGLATREHYISYILFIRALSAALHQEGLLLSIAIHPKQYFPKEVYQNADRVNLMTYDMITMEDGHHASYNKVVKAINGLIESGCEPNKIVVGLAAYGRHKDSPGKVKMYSDVIEDIHTKRLPMKKTLLANDEHLGFLFDSPVMIKEKVKMAFEKNLAGVFLWELGQDYFFDEQYSGGFLLQSAAMMKKEMIASQKADAVSKDEL